MTKRADLSYLLRVYSQKQDSAEFDLLGFCVFLHKYAHKYIGDDPELENFLDIGTEVLAVEMQKLKDSGVINFKVDETGNGKIVISHYYIDQIKRTYRNIEEKVSIPYPILATIPKHIASRFSQSIQLDDDFMEITPTRDSDEFIYALSLNAGLPVMLFPSSFSIDKILMISLSKLKLYLDKDESSDYINKRLSIANPGKSFTIKTFLGKVQSRDRAALDSILEAGDSYLLWGQMCTFIRQEFDKRTEKLAEEIALLQSISIIEYASSYYRNQVQKNLQRETALKNLKLELQKPPYYYSISDMSKFRDSRGVPLLGQYTRDDFQNFINEQTMQNSIYIVPDLLIFKNYAEENFFVLAEKIIPLIISMANDNRREIRTACIKKWKGVLMVFEQEEAMKSDIQFEKLIKSLTEAIAPNLYGLLTTQFLKSIAQDPKIKELQPVECSRIFPNGKLLSFSELLLLDRHETLKDTKILLPFWYTVPIVSSIIAFFKRSKKIKEKEKVKDNSTSSKNNKSSMKIKANEIKDKLIPEGSTIEKELTKTLDLWNQNLDPTLRNNLTEDVNSLIRDYLRGVQRSLNPKTFDEHRLDELSTTLINNPGLLKITDKNSLHKYIQLYLLYLMRIFF